MTAPVTLPTAARAAPPAAARATPAAWADAFAPVENAAAAFARVRRLALGHYENFSVVSAMVPRALRQDFCNLYAFCRTADDLGDETGDPGLSLRYLADLRDGLSDCYAGRPRGAVFTALLPTIQKYAIPATPFEDLISAFEQDQTVTRYETIAQLTDYCRRSADPVGRLVLYVSGYRDADRQALSDHTCTALQLANFWQDVRRDYETLGRVYVPAEWMRKFGVDEADFRAPVAGLNFRRMMAFAVDHTEALFDRGDALLATLDGRTAAYVGLFAAGGRAVLDAIRRQDHDTLARRPKLGRGAKARLVLRAAAARLFARGGKGKGA